MQESWSLAEGNLLSYIFIMNVDQINRISRGTVYQIMSDSLLFTLHTAPHVQFQARNIQA
jgi:hypothetical protein